MLAAHLLLFDTSSQSFGPGADWRIIYMIGFHPCDAAFLWVRLEMFGAVSTDSDTYSTVVIVSHHRQEVCIILYSVQYTQIKLEACSAGLILLMHARSPLGMLRECHYPSL